MRKYGLLCFVVLAGSLSGCQKAHLEPYVKQDVHSSSTYFQDDINLEILPDLITSVFENLGIQIEQTHQLSGQYEVIGTSLSGESVNVKASALIIGKSILVIEVKGQHRVSDALVRELREAIIDAIRDYERDKMKS